jgi:hypothetical protein
MSKIGVIFTSFNHAEYLHDALTPWIQARAEKLNGHEFVIAAVSVPFKEYQDMEVIHDNTTELLREYYNTFQIDHLIDSPKFITEADARDRALQFLLREGVDMVWLHDGDEVVDTQQLSNILDYVTLNKWISWFSISYKNYVFTEDQYLEQPFCPPRIFRTQTNGYKIKECVYDNDFSYEGQRVGLGTLETKVLNYRELPTKVIPPHIANPAHYSWLNTEKVRLKIKYQKKRWGEIGCSYAWGKDGLEFNEVYYKKHGLALPRVIKEEKE